MPPPMVEDKYLVATLHAFRNKDTMPTCCIKNCKNRTDHNTTKSIKYFSFPKETAVRQQWLNACQRKESDMKVDSARICSIHFEENCFSLEKTNPRLINQPAKEVLRLKKGCIPTKFLILDKKRKGTMSQSKENNKKIKVPVKSFVPTYIELVQYAQQKQHLSQEETVTNVETDVVQNMEEAVKNMQEDTLQDIEEVTKNIDEAAIQNMEDQNEAVQQEIVQEIGNNSNVYVETLLMQLRKSEEQNQKLLDTNKNLEEKTQYLSIQVAQLQAELKTMAKNRHKEAETIAIDALRKVFTPGQIKMLLSSTKNHVKWSSEDIMSAISLRSLSPKAYRYLRNVKKFPLPCATTLRNWVDQGIDHVSFPLGQKREK
ncbi:uncharacterized protein [Temnothorax nylanderi]|uniref:uncharacterized protein isoform X2 n=1 Tax=Temnothorax nylanderi TaxID=102681 RepID=UPI003A8376F3